jgi:tetratricopeptide (TPR) repeat protein
MRKISFSFFFILIFHFGFAQSKEDSLFNLLNKSKGSERINVLTELSKHYRSSNFSLSFDYAIKALEESNEISDEKTIADCNHNVGISYYYSGDYYTAINYFKESYRIRTKIADSDGAANSLNNLGVMHRKLGQLDKALDYYHQSLQLKEQNGDKADIVSTINNIGGIYYTQQDYDKAEQYYIKALKLFEETDNPSGIAAAYSNLSLIYFELQDYPKALKFNEKSYEIREALDDVHNKAASLNNFGRIYESMGEAKKAIKYFSSSADLYNQLGDKLNYANCLNNLGGAYGKLRDFEKAGQYFNESLQLAQELNNKLQIRENYKSMATISALATDYRSAYEFLDNFVAINDSIKSEESASKIAELETIYQTEQKEKEIYLLTKENEFQEYENRQKKIFIYILFGGTVLVLVIALLLFIRNRERQRDNKKLEKQNHEILLQKKEIEYKSEELILKNKEITDSIKYAKRIQEAIFPPEILIKETLPDSFVFFKPKDIVSGDFYWMSRKSNKSYFAAVDCTGHGVPGAFMSIVGHNLLNQAVNEHNIDKPSEILNYLNLGIHQTLRQTYEESKVKDGMDIALCSLVQDDISDSFILEYSGANNPLWIFKKNEDSNCLHNFEFLEVKADKHPIGTFVGEELKPFTNHKFILNKDDRLFIFSDGFADQFGGEKGKKFKYNQMRELLLQIQDKTMDEQTLVLNSIFDSWKGELEQVDDVCIIGVRV